MFYLLGKVVAVVGETEGCSGEWGTKSYIGVGKNALLLALEEGSCILVLGGEKVFW